MLQPLEFFTCDCNFRVCHLPKSKLTAQYLDPLGGVAKYGRLCGYRDEF